MSANIPKVAPDVNGADVKEPQAQLRLHSISFEREFVRTYRNRLFVLHNRGRVDGRTSEQLRDALKINSKCGPLWKRVVLSLRRLGYRHVHRGRVGAQVRVWAVPKVAPPFRDIDGIRSYYRLIDDMTLFYEAYRRVHYEMRGERAPDKDLNFLRTQVKKDSPYRSEYKMLCALVHLFADAVDCDEDDALLRQEKRYLAFCDLISGFHTYHLDYCIERVEFYPFSIKSMHMHIVCMRKYTLTRRVI